MADLQLEPKDLPYALCWVDSGDSEEYHINNHCAKAPGQERYLVQVSQELFSGVCTENREH